MQKRFLIFSLCCTAFAGMANLNAIFGLNGSQTVEFKLTLPDEIPAEKVGNFFQNIGDALPRMEMGIESIGKASAKGMDHMGKVMLKNLAFAGAISLTGYIFQVTCGKYIAKYLFEPALIEKKSSTSLLSRLKAWAGKPQPPLKLSDHLVVSSELAKELEYVIQMTSQIKKHGGDFEHILLHGAPGTGKTLFAQIVAEQCGMDFAYIPAANVSQFLAKGTAVEELNNLFAWAEGNSRGTILVFDEAETFLANRTTLDLSAQNALASFLAKTGTPSNKIMIMCATNRPEALDTAVQSRLGLQLHFDLPDEKARYDQLVMHRDAVFKAEPGKSSVDYTLLNDPAILSHMAQATNGCSGRTIQKLMNRTRQFAIGQGNMIVTNAIIERALTQLQNTLS